MTASGVRTPDRAAAAVVSASATQSETRGDNTFIERHQRADRLECRTGRITPIDGAIEQGPGHIERKPAVIFLLVRSRKLVGIVIGTGNHGDNAAGLGL